MFWGGSDIKDRQKGAQWQCEEERNKESGGDRRRWQLCFIAAAAGRSHRRRRGFGDGDTVATKRPDVGVA